MPRKEKSLQASQPDPLTPTQRARNMRNIKSKNTKPEMMIRSGLFKLGYRFRIHCKDLPGKPDIVMHKHNVVIMVNGCFWHGHECSLFKQPNTRKKFWGDKISGNISRDKRTRALLINAGWRVATVWECSLKGTQRLDFSDSMDQLSLWIQSKKDMFELYGL